MEMNGLPIRTGSEDLPHFLRCNWNKGPLLAVLQLSTEVGKVRDAEERLRRANFRMHHKVLTIRPELPRLGVEEGPDSLNIVLNRQNGLPSNRRHAMKCATLPKEPVSYIFCRTIFTFSMIIPPLLS